MQTFNAQAHLLELLESEINPKVETRNRNRKLTSKVESEIESEKTRNFFRIESEIEIFWSKNLNKFLTEKKKNFPENLIMKY